jgi:predicted esterase
VIQELSVETPTHGRVLLQDAADSVSRGLIVALHGYGQAAEDMLAAVSQIPGASHWRIAAVQGLHRFYTRDGENVVASWMTRQNRDLMTADNVAYIDRVIDQIHESRDADPRHSQPIVIAGFSQGAAMAYRSALLGRHAVAGIVALGGDIPPEIRNRQDTRLWPQVLIGAGATDWFYTSEKVEIDVSFLAARGLPFELARYDGGHVWTDEFRVAAGDWLARLASGT